jgi:hypothetical protein
MGEAGDFEVIIDRGAPLVATWPRWAILAAAEAAVVFGLAYAYVSFAHPKDTTLASLAPWLVAIAAALALTTFVLLRAEEARLARELRTARSGTELIRGLVLQRRQKAPFFLRYLSTSIGTAAVLVAEGDKSGAAITLGNNSALMGGGLLGRLREVVEADIDRSKGALDRTLAKLRDAPRIGNTEADRYKTHVLAKAVLQKGDGELALAEANRIRESKDEDERLYAVWLTVWYDFDQPQGEEPALTPCPTEPELRLAALLARTHGAEDLVKKLDARVAALSGRPPIPVPVDR